MNKQYYEPNICSLHRRTTGHFQFMRLSPMDHSRVSRFSNQSRLSQLIRWAISNSNMYTRPGMVLSEVRNEFAYA